MNYKILLLLLLPLLIACDKAENKYDRGFCKLIINNESEHSDPTLAKAMTPYSNVFVCITTTTHDGATFFRFTDNHGSPATESRFTAPDVRRQPIIGMNNAVIVGYGNGTTPVFYAYDAECPNCFDFNRLPLRSYRLQLLPSGLAECKNCKRTYAMNEGGFVAKGDGGASLIPYPGSAHGPYGVLQVIK
ncbi:MAG: hypothetical protein IJS97_05260 [Prevotella sp.]|nr:hypothetical protein [Prevotella sp.]